MMTATPSAGTMSFSMSGDDIASRDNYDHCRQCCWSAADLQATSMNETLAFVVRHGAAVLFAAVFVEQLGIPLPAAPWLLAAGALSVTGKMNWVVALSAAAFGSVLADLIWFYLGRHGGQRVLSLLCRISLEPDSC